MAVQGLIGTGSFVADERPKNWRQGILMRFPNGNSPLVGLTSALKSRAVDDPEYSWWERQLANQRIRSAEDMDATETVLTVVADPFGFGGADNLRPGHLLMSEQTEEIMRVVSIAGNDVTVVRAWTGDGVNGTAFLALTGVGVNPNLLIIGNVNQEGSLLPEAIRYRAAKQFNYTQIFRDSLKVTRTAMKTRLRTKEEVADAKAECLQYHSIGIEWSLIFGKRKETTLSGQPVRSTGGIVSFIPAGNRFNNAGADLELEVFEEHLLNMFRFGSTEKMAFMGMRAMLGIQQLIRKNSNYDISPSTKEFGMDVRRIFTPFGTLVMKTHPLFQYIQGGTAPGTGAFYGLDSWMLVLDMAQLGYVYLKDSDTKYLPNRGAPDLDGEMSEYLTECGMETYNGICHYLITGINKGIKDV